MDRCFLLIKRKEFDAIENYQNEMSKTYRNFDGVIGNSLEKAPHTEEYHYLISLMAALYE